MKNIKDIANIKRIESFINGKNRFFFIPWVGKDYEEGIEKKKVLVVGASHYCNHSNICKHPDGNNNCSNFDKVEGCKLGCKHFEDCTGGNTSKYNESCEWMCPEEYSSLFKELCSKIDYAKNGISCKQESTTLGEVCNFLNNDCSGNASFTKFTNFNAQYVENGSLWEYIAFVNYAQNFQPKSTGNSFRDQDYEAFEKYLELLDPDVVIVWGKVGNELVRRGFMKKTNPEDYIWKDGKRTYLHTYHPSFSGYKDGGKLEKAMKEVFPNKINAEK